MTLNKFLAAGALVLASAVPALAMDAKIYAYNSGHNFCPNGTQPITIDGVICCGTPNQSVSYQQMQAHPVPRKHYKKKKVHRVKHTRRMICPAGEKGCYYE